MCRMIRAMQSTEVHSNICQPNQNTASQPSPFRKKKMNAARPIRLTYVFSLLFILRPQAFFTSPR
jgi:hypothetical protein